MVTLSLFAQRSALQWTSHHVNQRVESLISCTLASLSFKQNNFVWECAYRAILCRCTIPMINFCTIQVFHRKLGVSFSLNSSPNRPVNNETVTHIMFFILSAWDIMKSVTVVVNALLQLVATQQICTTFFPFVLLLLLQLSRSCSCCNDHNFVSL